MFHGPAIDGVALGVGRGLFATVHQEASDAARCQLHRQTQTNRPTANYEDWHSQLGHRISFMFRLTSIRRQNRLQIGFIFKLAVSSNKQENSGLAGDVCDTTTQSLRPGHQPRRHCLRRQVDTERWIPLTGSRDVGLRRGGILGSHSAIECRRVRLW
jgi:hypothetical protein